MSPGPSPRTWRCCSVWPIAWALAMCRCCTARDGRVIGSALTSPAWRGRCGRFSSAALWRRLLRLYEGCAHTALGYASWSDYCAAEFDVGKSRAYQLLAAGRVAAELEAPVHHGGLNLKRDELEDIAAEYGFEIVGGA